MDNTRLNVVSEGDEALRLALSLALSRHVAVTHWKVVYLRERPKDHGGWTDWDAYEPDPKGPPTLMLLWHDEGGAIPFPTALGIRELVPFIATWLRQADKGPEPDHDGSNGEGFRVFTQDWGHVFDHHYAVCGVQAVWAMYGK